MWGAKVQPYGCRRWQMSGRGPCPSHQSMNQSITPSTERSTDQFNQSINPSLHHSIAPALARSCSQRALRNATAVQAGGCALTHHVALGVDGRLYRGVGWHRALQPVAGFAAVAASLHDNSQGAKHAVRGCKAGGGCEVGWWVGCRTGWGRAALHSQARRQGAGPRALPTLELAPGQRGTHLQFQFGGGVAASPRAVHQLRRDFRRPARWQGEEGRMHRCRQKCGLGGRAGWRQQVPLSA